jgi:hypothetical protein
MEGERHLDGNAIGGLLIDAFGHEMTDCRGCCASCGTVSALGALIVYRSGPGDVVRCPNCSEVMLVATPPADGIRVYLAAVRWMGPPS